MNNVSNCTVLIMAGGSGERFWPLSTKERPKQLLKLIDSNRSLIRMTVDRVTPLIPTERIFIATNAIQAPAVKEELPEIPLSNIILEPAFKDTAAAIGYSSIIINDIYPDSVMVVLASDHLIKDEQGFRSALSTAIEVAESDNAIITLGIKPTSPETGYGYLQVRAFEDDDNDFTDLRIGSGIRIGEPAKVEAFREKPTHLLAYKYVSDGKHLWNSGMFIFKIPIMLDAFRRLLPNHYSILMKISSLGDEMRDIHSATLKELFNTFEKISIDFGIMEKFEKIFVIPVDFGWSDIGSYPALEDVFEPNKNATITNGTEAKEVNSARNIIISTTGKKISLLGVEDMVIVDTPNNIMICSKKEAQNIKKLL